MTSSQRMRADVGHPLSEPIIRNGQPEVMVRINSHQIAVTFVKRLDSTSGGGISTIPLSNGTPLIFGDPIVTRHAECRYTLIVEAKSDHLPPYEMIVTGFRAPAPECE